MNANIAPTADFATNPNLDLSSDGMEAALERASGENAAHFVPATSLATALMGDAIYTNPFLLGMAFQLGKLPVSEGALHRAIELNGRAIEANKQAFAWGAWRHTTWPRCRRPRGRRSAPRSRTSGRRPSDAFLDKRSTFLVGYQNSAPRRSSAALVERVREREAGLGGDALAFTVARNYAKLIAYKDEYEVSRLFADGRFQAQIEAEFEGDYQLVWHAAPPSLPVVDWLLPSRKDPRTGRTKKMNLGAWSFALHKVLAKLKFLRGTPLDLFGRTEHRRLERQLITEYEQTVDELLDGLNAENLPLAIEIANMPEHVRGFETVKEEQLETARAKQTEQLEAFRRLV